MSQLLVITTIEQFQQHFPITYTENGFKRLKPYLHIAQRDYLKPVLGSLLTDLLEYHNASDGSGSGESESASGSGGSTGSCLALLLPYAQTAAAFLAIYEGFSQLEISIGANGIVQASDDKEKQAIFSGQRVDSKRDILKHGMNAVEEMLVFLEENKTKACFQDWAESDERTDMLGHILPTAKIFTQYWSSMGDKRLTYMALRSRMIDVEEDIVCPTLGETLYEELMGQLKAEVSDNNKKLLKYLRPMVAKYTAARGMPELMLYIEAFGVFHNLIEKNERSTQVLADAKDHRMYEVKERLNQEAEMHRDALINYLNKNVATYPKFEDSDAYIPEDETSTDSTTETTGGVRYRL